MALSDKNLTEINKWTEYESIDSCFSREDPLKKGLMPNFRQAPPLPIDPLPKELNPSGFDLSVGYFIAESDTLHTSLKERDFFRMGLTELKPGQTFTLNPNKFGEKIYYISSYEKLKLPRELEAIIDARSTTGRLGCMCHQVGELMDGEQIIAVQPFAFPITITSGKSSLAQAIIRYASTEFIDYKTLCENSEKIALLLKERDIFKGSLRPEGLVMTFSSHLVYRAKPCEEPINIDAVNELDPNQYFQLIEGDCSFTMNPLTFYLAGTREAIQLGNICGRISRESHISGTGLWSHFAGFVQPGFSGGITLECYSLGKRVIKNREPAGTVMFDKVESDIENSYQGSYQHQKVPKLPKMFKEN